MKKINIIYKNIIYPLSAVVIFIAVWAAAAAAVGIEMILPSPFSAFKRLFEMLFESGFYLPLFATVARSIYSFIFSFLLALILAVLGGIYNPLHRLLSPVILILRATPTISIILLSLIWLPSGTAPVLIAFLIVFPSMYAAIYGGIISVDKGLLEMSEVYRVNKSDIITKLYIPHTAPVIFSTVKSNISLNLKIIIASEVLAQTKGSMGLMMQLSKAYLDTGALMAWTVAAVIASYILELLVELLKRAVIRRKI